MVKLTLDLVAETVGKRPPSVTTLSLRGKNFDEISSLDALTNLVRLDLSQNRLTSIEALSCCKNLKWLSVAQNELTSLCGVQSLSHLTVLNGSRNQIGSMKEVKNLSNLCALILNDNQIHSICKLKSLKSLNTLVLSRNPISNPGTSLQRLSLLEKLSLSDCQLHDLDWAKGLIGLEELRLAHNKITDLPEFLGGIKLRILDLGNNCLRKFSKINVLHSLTSLRNLNLRGNPISMKESYEDEVRRLLPHLSILDGRSPRRDITDGHSKAQSSPKADMLKKIRKFQQSEQVVEQQCKKDDSNGKHEIRTVANSAANNIEDKPFIELIMQKESTAKKEDANEKRKPTKDDSGIVLITTKKKSLKRGRDAQNYNRSSAFFTPPDLDIGTGGPSRW